MKTKLILFLFLTINLGVPLGFIPINEASAQEFTNSTGTYFDFNNGTVNHLTFANGTAVPQIVIPDPATPPDFAQLSEPPFTVSYDMEQFPDQALNIIDNGDTITIENKGVSSVYNKDTCSLSLFNPNEIETEFAKESWSVHSAIWGSDNWNGLPVNSEVCETGFSNTQHTATIDAVRQNDDGIFRVQYSFDLYSIKTTVYYTNYNENTFGGINNDGSVWYGNPTKFGFVNSFSSMQTDVSDLQDGFTQSGTDFVINEQYDIEYKFLDSTRLLWGINNNVDNIYIDFKKVSKPTQYGQSQVIDPHLTAHPSSPTNVDADQTEVLKIDLDWDLPVDSVDDSPSLSGVSFTDDGSISQQTRPNGIDFSPDGLKFIISDEETDDVVEFSLSTAWDVSSTIAVEHTKDISSQEGIMTGVKWGNAGGYLFVTGVGDQGINRWTCSTDYDLSSCSSHDGSWESSGHESSPYDLAFSSDGENLYVLGHQRAKVHQIGLSTAWDLSTGFHHTSFNELGEFEYSTTYNDNMTGIDFNDDGTKMFLSGSGNNENVMQFDLSTAWDVTTSSHAYTYDLNDDSSVEDSTNGHAVFIGDSGSKMYTVGWENDKIYQYDVSNTVNLDDPTGYRIYEVSTGTSATYSTDFSTDTDWSADTTHLNIGNDKLSFDLTDASTDEYMVYDLGVINDENWILRHELVFDTLSDLNADQNAIVYFGITDDETPDSSGGGYDGIWFGLEAGYNGNKANKLESVNAGSITKADVNNNPFSSSTTTGKTYYIETKRVSETSAEMRVFENSDYSSDQYGSTMTVTTSSSVDNLQYLVVKIYSSSGWSSGGYTGSITNLEFCDDVTVWCVSSDTNTVLVSDTGDTDTDYQVTQTWGTTTTTTTYDFDNNIGSTGDCVLQNNASIVSSGYVGNALNTGSGDSCKTADNNQVIPTGAFTIAGWLYRTSDTGTHEQMVRVQASAGSSHGEFRIQNHSSDTDYEDKIACNFGGGTDYGTTSVPENEWVHWACSWDGSGDGKIYYNGISDRNDSVSGSHSSNVGSGYVWVGGRMAGDGDESFYGYQDNLTFYDVQLSDSEVLEHKNGSIPQEDNVLVFYDFEDTSNNSSYTSSITTTALENLTVGEEYTHKVSALNEATSSGTYGQTFIDDPAGVCCDKVNGQEITSGNDLIGKEITSVSFWIKRPASTGSEDFKIGVWDDQGDIQHTFGTISLDDVTISSGYYTGYEEHTGSDGSYTIEEDDIIGIYNPESTNDSLYLGQNAHGYLGGSADLPDTCRGAFTAVSGGGSASSGIPFNPDCNVDASFEVEYNIVTTYESDLSSSTSWTLQDDLPAPTNLTAQSGIPIQLDWDDVANAVTYQVYRDSGSGFTLLANAGSDSDYDDSSTVAGTSYDYKVSTLGPSPANLLESALSSQVTATAGQPPDAITTVTATISNAQTDPHVVTLTWGEPSDWQTGTPQSYEVFESVGSSGNMQSVSSALTYVAGTFTHTHNISGIQPLTDYYYLVRATSTHGTSADSNIPSVTTVDVPVKPDTPVATQPDTTATPYLVSLSWSDNGDGGSDIKGHQIDRWDSNSNAWTTIETDTGSVATTYQDTSIVSPAIDVKYRIGVINGVGVSTLSDESNTVTIPNTPLVPNNVSCTTDSSTQITVTWEVPSSDGGSALTYYNVYQPHPSNQVQYATNVYTHVATGLTQGTLYQFDVSAQNNVGDGSYASCTATTSIAPAGTFSITQDWIVYDTMEVSYLAVISAGNPSPTVEDIKIKLDGTTVATVPIGTQVSIGQQLQGTLQIKLPDLVQHDLTADMLMTNTGNEVTETSNTLSVIATFLPTYKPVVEGTGEVAWQLSRDEAQTSLNIEIFKDTAPFDVNCALLEPQEASEIVDRKITSMPSGIIWQNATSVGYHNATSTVNGNLSYYVFCYEKTNPYLLMFSDTSYTTLGSALASGLSGIQDSLGPLLGGPLIGIFVLMLAGQATGRTAPTFIIITIVAVGILMGLGFFIIDEYIWGLILIMGCLGVLVGKKFL